MRILTLLFIGLLTSKLILPHLTTIKHKYSHLTQIAEDLPQLQEAADLKQGLYTRGIGVLITDNNGNNLLVDPRDKFVSRDLIKKGGWENHISVILNKIVKPNYNILNLGAHIGYHTLLISKLIGNGGVIYCFEPNPYILKFLKFNITYNNANNIKLYEKAAYSEEKLIRFASINKGEIYNTGGSRIIPPGLQAIKNATEITVPAVKIDTELKDVDKIDLLQMDIEGAEPEAVYSAKELIDRSPNLTVIQEWCVDMMSKHSNINDYIKFWRERGYYFAQIFEDKLVELDDVQLVNMPDLIDLVITKDLHALQAKY